MLKHLKRVFVQFSPADQRATSARELLQRATSNAAKKSNPGCVVEFKVDENGQPGHAFVDLTFSDNESRRVHTNELAVQDITRLIEQKAGEMEMRSVMKDVGYDPWAQANRLPPSVRR